jgi:hypothetical protein
MKSASAAGGDHSPRRLTPLLIAAVMPTALPTAREAIRDFRFSRPFPNWNCVVSFVPRGGILQAGFFKAVLFLIRRLPTALRSPGSQFLPRCHWPAERISAHKEEEIMRRIALFILLAGFLVPALASAPAYAQTATRTWVSGTGDDTNPCSRTAPCKTFAAAISVTDTNGEINCVDPGGYGTLTITKSITIDCSGTFGSILSAGVNGITINLTTSPDPLSSVILRGLNINGAGGGTQSGLRGVSILSAAVVTLEDVVIMNHTQQGVADVRTTPGKLFIKNSVIRNNAGVGIVVAATGGTNMASIENVHSINNLYGLAAGSGNQIKVTRSLFSGNSNAGIVADVGAVVGVDHSTFNFNLVGLQTGGTIMFSDTDISFNSAAMSGPTTSFGDNRIYANTSPGTAPTVGATSTDHGKQ